MRKAEQRPKWLLRATAAEPAGNPDVHQGHCVCVCVWCGL